MLTVTQTSARREERALVAQPYGEHREGAGSWPGRDWLAGGDLHGKSEKQHRMTALAGSNPQGPNPTRLCSHWLSWPATPSGSWGL